ncbi:MFS transporter [Smaragdicoccus niigatensis]|uniref:MFS transporter n=1 Tax=Smaragdicoccus niigatensis TaxID=359359 RepID=UPI00047589BD|nr:MFS transporter [Smaragdicoccus niigatensis]
MQNELDQGQTTPTMSDKVFRSLPHVRALITAELCSAIGSTMAVLAVAFLSYNDSKSVIHTVLVSAAFSLPTALLGTFAGRVAARSSHRRLLLLCNVVKLVLYLAMAALAFAGDLTIPLLLASSVVLGAVAAFDYPAWMQFERDIVPSEALDQANASLSAYASGATFVGGVVGGIILSVSGPWVLLLLNAVSYVAFILFIVSARVSERDTTPTERVGLRAIVRYVRSKPAIAVVFVQTAILGLFVAPIAQLLPAVADALSGEATLGIVTGAVAVGAVGLAAIVGRLRQRLSRMTILFGTFLIAGLTLIVLGVFGDHLLGVPLWFVVLLALVPFGLLFSLAQAVLTAIVQTQVDPGMEGPVFSNYAIIYTLAMPIGGVFLGRFADVRDVWGALGVAGAMALIASMTALVVRQRGVNAIDLSPTTSRLGLFDGLFRGNLLHLQHDLNCNEHRRTA